MSLGTDVFASYDGIVVRKEWHKGMGNVVGTRFCNIVILYAHLSEFKIDLGQVIKQGDLLGLSGNTGEAIEENPHLHFEMRDISIKGLKNMVFDPPFNKELSNLKKTFVYKVNNEHTQKTLKYLIKQYFGNQSYHEQLLKFNPSLKKYRIDEPLLQDIEVIIPNF